MSQRDPRILVVFASLFAIGTVFALHTGNVPLAMFAALAAAFSAGEAWLIKKTETENTGRVTDGGEDIVNPRIESVLTCGHCGEEWEWTFEPDQDHYEIECPGCGATWTSANA